MIVAENPDPDKIDRAYHSVIDGAEEKIHRNPKNLADKNLSIRQVYLKKEQAQLALEESAGKSDQTKLESYLNAMEASKVQLDMALIELEKSKVTAPFTGIVKTKRVQVGG